MQGDVTLAEIITSLKICAGRNFWLEKVVGYKQKKLGQFLMVYLVWKLLELISADKISHQQKRGNIRRSGLNIGSLFWLSYSKLNKHLKQGGTNKGILISHKDSLHTNNTCSLRKSKVLKCNYPCFYFFKERENR